MEWIEQDRFDQEGLKSQFHFMPKSSKDYGNLYCIGENAIGTQEEPCIFNIVPTGKSIIPPTPFSIFMMHEEVYQSTVHRLANAQTGLLFLIYANFRCIFADLTNFQGIW